MSLLEDVFLQDEAGEAQDLERVIEGDEFYERHPDDSSDGDSVRGDDEAEEDKRRVDPGQTKQPKVVKNPRFVLNPARLMGPRGIQIIPEHFKDFKFKGKGHEKEDLDMVLKKLEHWAYRLYPKFKFEDCLKKIETLGKKRQVMVHLHKIRNDQITSEETVVQQDSSDDETPVERPAEEDEFDKLLQQQIELARTTPGPSSAKKHGFTTPGAADVGTPFVRGVMPKATSSPSINDEQRERMLHNRRLAEERRLAKLKQNNPNVSEIMEANNETIVNKYEQNNDKTVDLTEIVGNNLKKKQNKSNIIESSDEEVDLTKETHSYIQSGEATTDKIVDLTHIGANTETTQNKRKSNAIDSSDEEVDLTKEINTLTADIHKPTASALSKDKFVDLTDIDANNGTHTQRKHKTNIIDSGEDEDLSPEKRPKTDKNKAFDDYTKNNIENLENTEKYNKSNVIDSDSSDDDCDMTTVNQYVTVDIHKSIDEDQENTGSKLVYDKNNEIINDKSKKEGNNISIETEAEKYEEVSEIETMTNKENIFNNISKDNNLDKPTPAENDVMGIHFSDEF